MICIRCHVRYGIATQSILRGETIRNRKGSVSGFMGFLKGKISRKYISREFRYKGYYADAVEISDVNREKTPHQTK